MSQQIHTEQALDDELEAATFLAQYDDADLSIYNVDDGALVIVVRDDVWAATLLSKIQEQAAASSLAAAFHGEQEIPEG